MCKRERERERREREERERERDGECALCLYRPYETEQIRILHEICSAMSDLVPLSGSRSPDVLHFACNHELPTNFI